MKKIESIEACQDAVRGFWTARVLLTAAELDLLAPITRCPSTASEVATSQGTDPRATEIVLDALTALGLIHKDKGRYHASTLATRHLSSHSEEPVMGMLQHQAELWDRWSQLTDVVRTGQPAPRQGDQRVKHHAFIRAMHDMKRHQGPSDWIPISLDGVRTAIDLGGGPGTLAVAIAETCPEATVVLFDRPATIEVAATVVPSDLWQSRVVPRAGDLLVEPSYGAGFDLAVLSAVLHSMGPKDAALVTRRAVECLAPGGRLLIRETILDDDRSGPARAALFAVNMLVGTPEGRSYTASELTGWMRDGGLVDIQRLPDGRGDALVGTRA